LDYFYSVLWNPKIILPKQIGIGARIFFIFFYFFFGRMAIAKFDVESLMALTVLSFESLTHQDACFVGL
jgi:hypothetical protein